MAEGKERYVIVRADNVCPARINNLSCNETKTMLRCKCGKDIKKYGDTKEQLIKKITTVLRREKIKRGLTYYWLATKIVEFLGVK